MNFRSGGGCDLGEGVEVGREGGGGEGGGVESVDIFFPKQFGNINGRIYFTTNSPAERGFEEKLQVAGRARKATTNTISYVPSPILSSCRPSLLPPPTPSLSLHLPPPLSFLLGN